MGRALLVLLLVCLVLPAASQARNWYIKPDGTGDAPTIQAGIDSAAAGDYVVLADGTYRGNGNRDLVLRKRITLMSESGDPQRCVIDCEGSQAEPHQGMSIWGGGLARGITITDGWREYGGAVMLGGDAVLSNCRFVGNHASEGGGAMLAQPSFDRSNIYGCVFEDNTADYSGGAIDTEWYYALDLHVEDCVFVGNSALGGGAISCWIEDLYDELCIYDLVSCTFVGDSGINGADIYSEYGGIEAFNCIFAYGRKYRGQGGYPMGNTGYGTTWMSCCDVYGYEAANYFRNIADQMNVRGNFSACPSFCHGDAQPYDLRLCSGSPCLPGNHPSGYDCGLIGAFGQGCGCGASVVEPTTWGAIKARFK